MSVNYTLREKEIYDKITATVEKTGCSVVDACKKTGLHGGSYYKVKSLLSNKPPRSYTKRKPAVVKPKRAYSRKTPAVVQTIEVDEHNQPEKAAVIICNAKDLKSVLGGLF